MQQEDCVQREQYLSIEGPSRLAAYPDLLHSGREYSPAWEEAHGDLGPVREWLADNPVARQVDASGKVSL